MIVQIIKHAVASDREGNFHQYAATVQDSISLFAMTQKMIARLKELESSLM